MKLPVLTTEIRTEQDVVLNRQRAREIAEVLGFESQDQTRLATAVSELARNAFQYAGGGRIEFAITGESDVFTVTVSDRGPGIPHLSEILGGRYESKTGMGIGIIGSKRLVDEFQIQSAPGGGTLVSIGKRLPQKLDRKRIEAAIARVSNRAQAFAPMAEIRQQNVELIDALDALRERQAELAQLNRELEDTNRGVVALYAELDEKAEALKRANSTKTRFLANMTHEFRSPLNSVIQLSKLLIDESDGPLNEEQSHQVRLIRKAAEGLWELVNDLLDISKVEAGKLNVRPAPFDVSDVFSSLRGLMKPIAGQFVDVKLQIEELADAIPVYSDESKLAQIVRNLVSNALKYTERGTVIVSAGRVGDDSFRIDVKDTGIGIAAEDQERIFEEFYQVESKLQAISKGTGLGLSLTRKLAELLGGKLELQSEPGKGSTFSVILPLRYAGPEEAQYISQEIPKEVVPAAGLRVASRAERPLVLLIDDREEDRYLLRSTILSLFECDVVEANDGVEGLRVAKLRLPAVAFLDLNMPQMTGFAVLEAWNRDPELMAIPIVIHSAQELSHEQRKALSLGATAVLSKGDLSEEELIERVSGLLGKLEFARKRPA